MQWDDHHKSSKCLYVVLSSLSKSGKIVFFIEVDNDSHESRECLKNERVHLLFSIVILHFGYIIDSICIWLAPIFRLQLNSNELFMVQSAKKYNFYEIIVFDHTLSLLIIIHFHLTRRLPLFTLNTFENRKCPQFFWWHNQMESIFLYQKPFVFITFNAHDKD